MATSSAPRRSQSAQTQSFGKTKCDDAVDIFAAAIKSFESSIAEPDRRLFHNYKDSATFLSAIQDQVNRSPDKGRLLSCCKKIDKFAQKWEPFFEITNLFVNSPEWASIAWGAVRLVFKLSGHYATFFEKLADMFEKIAERLPLYTQLVLMNRRLTHSLDKTRHERLLQALALIYSDILGVCQRACKIFSIKGNGVRYKLGVINDIFWRPFDMWFSEVLNRLSRHESFFDLELSLTAKEDAMAHHAKFDQEVENARKFRESQLARSQEEEVHAKKEEARLLNVQIREIKRWIRAPNYTALLEREAPHATEGTCEWFMNHPKYRAWRDKNSDIASMLWVQGPPGYGKTVLSSFIIDDLKTLSFHTDNEDGNVVYFHFDRLSPDHKEPQHALRAILNQIVHTLRKYQDVVDGLTLLMDVGGTGQQFASEGDTATALSFVLHRYPNLTLLFDGLDECSDSATLLLKLFAIYGNSAVRIIILSRPEVALPNIWIEAATSIRLGDRENSISIERFVKPRVEQLIESDLLPSGVSTDYLVSTISSRANSLFLWAKLMMIYLECPALSRRARLQTINERNLLEGLDEMYSRIIDLIRNKLKPQREAAFKTFQWLVAAYRPLHFSELQAALAIRLGQATDADEDYIINFQQSLVSICGSLVYVQNDGTVQFIHLSVKEFLTRKPAVQEDTTPGIFQVDTSMAHFFVASSCLSYLRYDVPGHPLSGSSKVDPNKKVVREKLPLLCYSIDWWKNGLEGFTLLRDSFQIAFPLMANVFVPLARQFLDTKPTVTVWVEAIWTFSKTPPLLLLADHIAVFDKMLPVISRQKRSSQLQTILQLGADIAELDTDLSHLDGEWGRVLRDHPTEVWEPSINAFHCSRFLVRTDASNIAWVATTCSKTSEDTIPAVSATANFSANEIILLSDVSNDGSTLGSIRLIPSPAFLRVRAQLQSVTDTDSDDGDDDDAWSSSKASNSNISSSTDDLSRSEMAKRSALADSVSPGWRVRWRLDSMGPRISSDQDSFPIINFELPSEQVFNMLMMSFHDMDPSRLLIPVSFSPDLRKMAILQSVAEVSNHGFRLQHLDEDALKQANRCIREKPSRLQCVDPQLSKTMWQQSVFSPNGQVFAVFQSGEEPGQDGDFEYFDCSILIYSNDQSGSHSKRWRKINEKGPFDQVGGVKKPLVFHPVQKALVVIADDKTYLWNFERSSTLTRDYLENSTFKELYPRPLDDITFTDSGKYLFGVCDEYGTVRFTMPAGLLDANDHPQQSVGPIQAEETRITRHSQESVADLVASQVHAQGPLDLSLSWVGDTVQHTALHQYRNDSIVLTNLSMDGLERSAMLLRIPESVSEMGVSPTLLDPQGDSPVIRLVVNKAAQTKYDLMQNQSVVLPLIVERQKSTIETYTYKHSITYSPDNTQPPSKRIRM